MIKTDFIDNDGNRVIASIYGDVNLKVGDCIALSVHEFYPAEKVDFSHVVDENAEMHKKYDCVDFTVTEILKSLNINTIGENIFEIDIFGNVRA